MSRRSTLCADWRALGCAVTELDVRAPTSGEGDRLYNEGCAKSRAGLMREAADLLERSLQVMQQTYGLMHEGIADCYRQLAIIFTQAEQFEFAVSYQEKVRQTSIFWEIRISRVFLSSAPPTCPDMPRATCSAWCPSY